MARSTEARFLLTADDRTKAVLNKVESRLGAVAKRAGSIALAFGAGFGGAQLARQLVDITRQTDILNAQLRTATGSVGAAAVAFDQLERFAAQTPFALEQSIEAFVKLTNLGLTPSERAMRSYGDTASAMGKDLDQMIEAVADAATAEFERLKEFGIRAKNEGDTIAFTFRGITTRVANEAAAIEEFLIGLGETEFAGAMAERTDTLDGAISNLGDSWDGLFRQISGQGLGELIEGQVRAAISALDGLTSRLAAGSRNVLDVLSDMDTVNDRIETLEGQEGAKGRGSRGARRAGRLSALQEDAEALGDELKDFLGNTPALEATLVALRERLDRLESGPRRGRRDSTLNPLIEETRSDIQTLEGLLERSRRATDPGLQPITLPGIEPPEVPDPREVPDAPSGPEFDAEARIEAAQQMFDRLHEMRLGDEDRRLELEQFRRDRQLEEIETDRQMLIDNNAMTKELEDQFREAKENAVAASEARIAKIAQQSAQQQAATEQQLQQTLIGFKKSAAQQAVGLLQMFAGESKGAALALLAITKGQAIANVLIRGQEAAMLARATIPFPAGEAIAAKMVAHSAISAGLIAATGIAQGAGVGSGGGGGGSIGGGFGGGFGGGAPPQLPPNPATQVQESTQNAASSVMRLEIVADGGDEIAMAMARRLRVLTAEGDVVMIDPDSRQAIDIRQGA